MNAPKASAQHSLPALLKKLGITPKKRLGQNFLIAVPTIQKIIASLEPRSRDVVIEIGSGLGYLTSLLAPQVQQVIAIERDQQLLEAAKTEHAHHQNITWVHGDILEQRLSELILHANTDTVKIVGNLPYNISSQILFWMLEGRALISLAVVMLQREVVMRIISPPGKKSYGVLSIAMQAEASVAKLFDISAKSFLPPPKVTSSVLAIDFTKAPTLPPHPKDIFRRLVQAAFQKRRKTLRNALLSAPQLGLAEDSLSQALLTLGIDPTRRPETLSVREFAELSALLERVASI